MSKLHTKLIVNANAPVLETQINNTLANIDAANLIDIKYVISEGVGGKTYSALIVYKN